MCNNAVWWADISHIKVAFVRLCEIMGQGWDRVFSLQTFLNRQLKSTFGVPVAHLPKSILLAMEFLLNTFQPQTATQNN